jgi:hypothetical protein
MKIVPVHPDKLDLSEDAAGFASPATPMSPSGRTLGGRLPSRRTLGFRYPSRRTLGYRLPSRRTLGYRLP